MPGGRVAVEKERKYQRKGTWEEQTNSPSSPEDYDSVYDLATQRLLE